MADNDNDSDDDDVDEPRGLVNLAALVFLALLVIGGVWLANAISRNSKLEDCLMAGRRNCAPIEVPR